jgi:hypothetical protein
LLGGEEAGPRDMKRSSAHILQLFVYDFSMIVRVEIIPISVAGETDAGHVASGHLDVPKEFSGLNGIMV